MVARLVGGPRQHALREIHDWSEADDRDAIRKPFHFADFNEAFGFVARVALLAERMGHHPEIHFAYDRVEITLTTPDVEALTNKYIALARAIDEVAPPRDTHH